MFIDTWFHVVWFISRHHETGFTAFKDTRDSRAFSVGVGKCAPFMLVGEGGDQFCGTLHHLIPQLKYFLEIVLFRKRYQLFWVSIEPVLVDSFKTSDGVFNIRYCNKRLVQVKLFLVLDAQSVRIQFGTSHKSCHNGWDSTGLRFDDRDAKPLSVSGGKIHVKGVVHIRHCACIQTFTVVPYIREYWVNAYQFCKCDKVKSNVCCHRVGMNVQVRIWMALFEHLERLKCLAISLAVKLVHAHHSNQVVVVCQTNLGACFVTLLLVRVEYLCVHPVRAVHRVKTCILHLLEGIPGNGNGQHTFFQLLHLIRRDRVMVNGSPRHPVPHSLVISNPRVKVGNDEIRFELT